MEANSEIERVVSLYRRFRQNFAQTPLPPCAPYHETFKGIHVDGSALAFGWFVSDALREIANSINDFGRYIRSLRAWQPIYSSLPVPEKHDLIIDHIRPLTILSLGAPQAIRGRLIHAATAASYHAAIFLPNRQGRPKWKGGHVDMKVASRLGQPWAAWPALAAALNVLGDEAFAKATGSFRNEHEHGHPRSIGIGETRTVRRVPPGEDPFPRLPGRANDEPKGEVWAIDTRAPLVPEALLPLFDNQHALALAAFEAFHALVVEQLAAAPQPLVTSVPGPKVVADLVPTPPPGETGHQG